MQDAKTKAGAHYNTPKTVHFDTLGRPVLDQEMLLKEVTTPTPAPAVIYSTVLRPDIEGNLRSVTDARGNVTMQYKYDILGQMVYQDSAGSGKRWLLHDCMGSPLKTWDERDHEIEFEYDALHRPLRTTVAGGDGPLTGLAPALINVVDFYEYGEGVTNDKSKNLRGNLCRNWDTGGLEETPEYYFTGQPKQTERWLAVKYKETVNWTTRPTVPAPSPCRIIIH